MEAPDSPPNPIWHTGTRPTLLPELLLPSPSKAGAGERASPRGPLWAIAAGYAAAVVSLLVLFGWAFGIDTFKSVLPNAMAMKPNTAISIVALGLAMVASAVLKPPYVPTARRITLTRLFALVPLIVGTLTLLEYVTDLNLGIDQLLFRDAVINRGGPFPGRSSTASTISVMLLGVSFLLLDAGSEKLRRFSQWPALIGTALSFVAMLVYLYGADQLYQVRPYASVALHTAVVMAALGVSFVLARPDRGIARELLQPASRRPAWPAACCRSRFSCR